MCLERPAVRIEPRVDSNMEHGHYSLWKNYAGLRTIPRIDSYRRYVRALLTRWSRVASRANLLVSMLSAIVGLACLSQ